MSRRVRRIAVWSGAAVLLIAVLAVGAAAAWMAASLPKHQGTILVNGPEREVRILRDPRGVPHIFAASESDAYFALGYAHGQDRLWQMDFLRRLAAGRLSEVLGARTVDIDRFFRVLGLHRLAKQQADAMPVPVRQALDAYADGVNAYLAARSGPLPPEFAALRYQPEPWQAADSVLWGRLMGMRLANNWREELLRLRMLERMSADRVDALLGTETGKQPISIAGLAEAAAALHAAIPSAATSDSASNAWVLAGARTATGKPILANDPHLGFGAPGLWYLARIVTPEWQMTGATVPGVPFHLLGHNGKVAWGMTTTHADTEDLVVETVDAQDPNRYLTETGAAAFVVRTETIEVKGEAAREMAVRATRNGPVISDVLDRTVRDGTVLALASTNFDRQDWTPAALYAMNHAADGVAFAAAARELGAPAQNLMYADIQGSIGLIAPGRLPVRRNGDGALPVEGRTGPAWSGRVPAEAVPHIVDPADGLLVNANNRLVGDAYPHLITRRWPAGYRAERILAVLDPARDHRLDDSIVLQLDALSMTAKALVPLLLTVQPDDATGRTALDLLARWDFRMDRDSPAALIYAAWSRALVRELANDDLGPVFQDYWRGRPGFLIHALRADPSWCDRAETAALESCDDAMANALRAALEALSEEFGEKPAEWRWGDAHRAEFKHQVLGDIPILGLLTNLSIETDGGDETVNRGTTAGGSGRSPFRHVHGPGFRAVFDLADLGNSRFTVAGGQAGHPLSDHYRDLLTGWRDGVSFTIDGSQATLEASGARVLRLRPVQ